jgi:hypothetical protein
MPRFIIPPTTAVVEAGLKNSRVDLAALEVVCWRFWAIYTENGIATRITIIKPNKNIFLYEEKMDIKIP